MTGPNTDSQLPFGCFCQARSVPLVAVFVAVVTVISWDAFPRVTGIVKSGLAAGAMLVLGAVPGFGVGVPAAGVVGAFDGVRAAGGDVTGLGMVGLGIVGIDGMVGMVGPGIVGIDGSAGMVCDGAVGTFGAGGAAGATGGTELSAAPGAGWPDAVESADANGAACPLVAPEAPVPADAPPADALPADAPPAESPSAGTDTVADGASATDVAPG